MITPEGHSGIAFGETRDGNPRSDSNARLAMSESLAISNSWAFTNQIHSRIVLSVDEPGNAGDGDGLVTSKRALPIAVTTADCVPVVLKGRERVSVVHCGWRGIAQGIVEEATRAFESDGSIVDAVVIGPHIGPCCYEVGRDVIDTLGVSAARTTRGTRSVDLAAAIRTRLPTVEVTDVGICTHHDDRFHSFRESRTPLRQVTVAWIPKDS